MLTLTILPKYLWMENIFFVGKTTGTACEILHICPVMDQFEIILDDNICWTVSKQRIYCLSNELLNAIKESHNFIAMRLCLIWQRGPLYQFRTKHPQICDLNICGTFVYGVLVWQSAFCVKWMSVSWNSLRLYFRAGSCGMGVLVVLHLVWINTLIVHFPSEIKAVYVTHEDCKFCLQHRKWKFSADMGTLRLAAGIKCLHR